MDILGKKALISIACGLLVIVSLWALENLLAAKLPLVFFNLASLLLLPGQLIVFVITAVLIPEKGWQAMHGVPPYDFYGYGASFLFYATMCYFGQSYFRRRRERCTSN